VDRLNLGNDKGECFADFGEQILELSDAREVFSVRTVFGELKGGKVTKALDLEIERLLEFQTLDQVLRRGADLPLPIFDLRVILVDPGEVLLPLANVREQIAKVPFV